MSFCLTLKYAAIKDGDVLISPPAFPPLTDDVTPPSVNTVGMYQSLDGYQNDLHIYKGIDRQGNSYIETKHPSVM